MFMTAGGSGSGARDNFGIAPPLLHGDGGLFAWLLKQSFLYIALTARSSREALPHYLTHFNMSRRFGVYKIPPAAFLAAREFVN